MTTDRGPMVTAIDRIMGPDDGTARLYHTEHQLREVAQQIDAAFAAMESALRMAEVILSPNMADHRCANFGDWRKEHDGDERYAGVPGKRCEECMGCARFFTHQDATAALALAEGVRS